MKALNAIPFCFLSCLLLLMGAPTVAALTNIEIVQNTQKNTRSAYGKLYVSHYPAAKPKTAPPPAQTYVAEISLKKPDQFDLILTGEKNATVTIGVANGKLIWKDSATGLSGSSAYDEAVDVALRVLLGNTASLKKEYRFSEYSSPQTKASLVKLDAVVMKPLQFGTQLRSMTVWLSAGKIVGVEAFYKDGRHTFASVGNLVLAS